MKNDSTPKTPDGAPSPGVGSSDLLGEGESQTPRTDTEIMLCSDGTIAVPADLARNMEHELGELRKAERLARVQLEKAREARDENATLRMRAENALREIRAIKPLNMACDYWSREMGLYPDDVFEICDRVLSSPNHE